MITIEIPKLSGTRFYTPKGLQGGGEFKPASIEIPAGVGMHIISGHEAETLLKDEETLLHVKKAHSGVIIRGLQHEEIIATDIEKNTPDSSDPQSVTAEKAALPPTAKISDRDAYPLIARATKAEDLEQYLKSDNAKIKNAAEKKLKFLKGA